MTQTIRRMKPEKVLAASNVGGPVAFKAELPIARNTLGLLTLRAESKFGLGGSPKSPAKFVEHSRKMPGDARLNWPLSQAKLSARSMLCS